MGAPARPISKLREWVRRNIGFIPIMEFRNQIFMGPEVPRIALLESREVARLRRKLAGVPTSAHVACIVPTYKRHDRLVAAIDSILKQTFQDFVVIVVDDGGGLPDLPSDPRIVAVSLSKNCGIAGVVRNVGIRLSSSEYVAFLDDDNTWHPEHLALCLDGLKAGQDLVYTAIARRTVGGREIDVISAPFDRKTLINEGYVDTSAIVVRRAGDVAFSRLPRGRTTLPGEDWEFVFRLSRRLRIKHIPIVTVDYLVNPDSFYTPWTEASTK
jgi:glycosyltransferase involved in cell wall biosynthesis